ncbi:MAG: tetratricopeptide repeat protein [Marinilabiliaceae bacterium]|nr:tetratricopeptide repeat protein [Marinilabiliaceae bacterium]
MAVLITEQEVKFYYKINNWRQHITSSSFLLLLTIILLCACSPKQTKNETSVYYSINLLLEEYNRQLDISPDSAFYVAQEALHLSRQIAVNDEIKFEIYNSLGISSQKAGQYINAIEYFNEALQHIKNIPPQTLAILYDYIGHTALMLDKTDVAMEYFPLSLKIYVELKDIEGQASSHRNIGAVYKSERRFAESEEYFNIAMNLYMQADNIKGQASCYNNLGGLYAELDEYEEALEHYLKSEQLCLEANDTELLLKVIYNKGLLMLDFREFEPARNEYLKVLDYAIEHSNYRALAETYYSLGHIMYKIDKADSAIFYFNKSIEVSQRFHLRDVEIWAFNGRADSYTKLGEYTNAIEDFILTSVKSEYLSIDNQTKARSFTEQYMQYKESIRQELEKDRRLNLQKFLITALGAVLLLIIFALFLINGNRQKKRTNRILSDQRDEIENQRNELSNQHREISQSIEAASLVQKAVLPPTDYLDKTLSDYFILNMPHDAVSGDFYWMTIKDQYKILAVADCTGHGACGAVVSMLGISSLNKIVSEMEVPKSDLILNQLRELIIQLLNPQGALWNTRNGMDIALIIYNTITREIEFSGAKNPLYIINNRKLIEKKADRMSIGIDEKQHLPFTSEKFIYKDGDTLYMFSDGYTDQFDSENKERFKKKQFKEFLLSISDKPMQEQFYELVKEHWIWRGDTHQTDDILILGVKF